MPSDKETENFDLIEKRPARYILLKPLTLRNSDKIISANDSPVEIGFFGLHGLPLEKSLQTKTHRTIGQNLLKIPSFKVKIEGFNGKSWTELLQVPSAYITDLTQGLKVSKFIENEVFNKVPLGGHCLLNVSNELLEAGNYSEIRVNVTANDKSAWSLSGVLLQSFLLKKD